MNTVTLTAIIFAGLLVGGGLLLHRQLKTAPMMPERAAAKPARKRILRRSSVGRLPPYHPRVTRRRTTRQWLQRLNREERRQRPGEGRN